MTGTALVLTNRVFTVPKEQQTACYRLFEHRHPCMVQQIFTLDKGLLAIRGGGTVTSGDEKWDRELAHAWVHIRPTPVEMVDLMEAGAALMFESAEVATKVYLDLVHHLRNWMHHLDINPNVRVVPLQDLEKFDELAAMVFPYANPLLMRNEEDAGYGAFMARRARRRRASASMAVTMADPTGDAKGALSVYESLSARIAEKLAKRIKEHQQQ